MHRLVIALTALLSMIGIVVVAGFLFVFGAATDRAAQLVPAGTPVYLNVYLQPSTGQRMNLSALLARLPGFGDQATLDEKIDQLAQNFLAEAGIDYRGEVRPWLGDQIAMALDAETLASDEAEPMVLIGVKDREAAEAALIEVAGRSGVSYRAESYQGVELHVADDHAWAFVAEMLVLGADRGSVERAIDTERGAGPALGDSSAFSEAMRRLPGDHLASVYLDLTAAAEVADSEEQMGGYSTASMAVVAESDGLRLVGSAPFDRALASEAVRAGFALGSEPSSLTEWMPEQTQASFVVFGVRQLLEEMERTAGTSPDGASLTDTLTALRAIAAFSFGINVDNDLLPLLDREAALAIADLGGEPRGQLLVRPSDMEAAAAALDRLRDGLERAGARVTTTEAAGTTITTLSVPELGDVSYAMIDGIAIFGLDADDVEAAIEAHETGRTLALTDAYRRTFERAGDRAGNELFVNVAGLVEAIGLDADMSADARDILLSIESFGFTSPSRDDYIEFHAVLTVE